MSQLRGVHILLAAGLLAVTPALSIAQTQGVKAGTQQDPNNQIVPYTPTPGFDRGPGFSRFADSRYDNAHGYAERRADDAWQRGDRKTACRWAAEARDRPGWSNERTAGKADQYCAEDKTRSDSRSSAGA